MNSKLVLHICCAPDEAYVIQCLGKSHDLYCFFSNPNISPEKEYEKRREDAQMIARKFSIPFTAAAYEPQLWENAVEGLLDSPEGGKRCEACFLLRFRQTARFCKEIGWPAFTSVMSISPHKNIHMLNATGAQAAAEYGVTYEPFNFKKQDGFKKSIELSNQLGLYRQDYCGCRLSKVERDARTQIRPPNGKLI